jgi:hypothetical protein
MTYKKRIGKIKNSLRPAKFENKLRKNLQNPISGVLTDNTIAKIDIIAMTMQKEMKGFMSNINETKRANPEIEKSTNQETPKTT